MEFEDVEGRIERECRRMAAAFGIEEWCLRHDHPDKGNVQFVGDVEGKRAASFFLDTSTLEVFRLFSGRGSVGCIVNLRRPEIALHGCGYELMARALYCLGFEDKGVWQTLGITFTSHEKLELRLSLPREFWPQKWGDEEGK